MIIRSTDRRRVETPNAAMVTLASPTQGGAASSVWLVDMPAGVTGPWHAFGGEIVWSILTGDAHLELAHRDRGTDDASEAGLGVGDTAVLPAGRLRRLTSGTNGFTAVVCAAGDRVVTREDGSTTGVPPWVA